jgi:uncharacterized membrane protein
MKSLLIIIALLMGGFVLSSNISLAQRAPDATLPDPGTIPIDTGIAEGPSLIETVSIIISWILGFIGIVIFVIFLFAGFEYATAGGDQSKAENASKRMVNAIIGLIIVFFAFVLSNAVLSFVFPIPPSTP